MSELSEIDRNARAYGYEIGRGQVLAQEIDPSKDNPFLDPNWRDRIGGEWSPAQEGDTPGELIPGEDDGRPQIDLEDVCESEMMREEFLGC